MVYSRRMTAKQYFGQTGFQRLLDEVFKKYVSLERVGGKIGIVVKNSEEADLLCGFFGERVRQGDVVEVPLKQFEAELYRGFRLTIPALYEVLESRRLLTRSEQAQLKERQWNALFDKVCEQVADRAAVVKERLPARIYDWLHRLRSGQASGSRVLQSLYVQDKDRALEELFFCTKALSILLNGGTREGEWRAEMNGTPWIRLPVLATLVTGDAHAFDRNRPLGRLLWYALSEIWRGVSNGELDSLDSVSEEGGANAADDPLTVRYVYRQAGIMDDDVSSQVIVSARPFSSLLEPAVLTLRQVEAVSEWPVYSELFVVENPSVFSSLLDAAAETLQSDEPASGETNLPMPALVCTSGQASAAAYLFIKKSLDAGNECQRLYYSGDFDLAGLQMAVGLEQRFPRAFHAWCMNSEVYNRLSEKGPPFSEEERRQLNRMEVSWDANLGVVMAEKGIKCFHEAVIPMLLSDWISAVRKGFHCD